MPARRSAGRSRGRRSGVGGSEQYRQMNVAEFFARNKQIAGFGNATRAVYQTVRELVENALDATDVHGILPALQVIIEYDEELARANPGKERRFLRVTVEDNGIGVPPNVVADAFGRVLYSSKYVNRQTRGMYGLGVKAAVLYGQMTAGTPVVVSSSTRLSKYVYSKTIYIDIYKNEPMIEEDVQWLKTSGWHGTRVTVRLEGNWSGARSRVLEYIRRTAIVAPYAEIILQTPEGDLYLFPRMTTELPPPPREVKPHPHGVDVEQMKIILRETTAQKLYQALAQEFQSVGERTARRFLKEAGFDPEMDPKRLLSDDMKNELVRLVTVMKTYAGFRAPRSDHLSPIGEKLIVLGLRRMFSPEFATAVTRPPRAHGGHSFVVEAGIAYGGEIRARDEPLLLRYANKIPLLYEEKEGVMYKVVSRINWKHYRVDFPAPLVVLVHIASTRVPYKGVGKESIAEVPEIEREIRIAVMTAARRLARFLARKRREEEARKRIITISKYIPEIARSLAILSKPPDRWEPPREEEERAYAEALVRLVARHIPVPTVREEADGREKGEEDAKHVIRSLILGSES